MKLICLLWIIAFAEPVDPASQAETFMNYVSDLREPSPLLGFDNSGNLWTMYKLKTGYHLSIINPRGKHILEKVPLGFGAGYSTYPFVVFDRWDNAYFMIADPGHPMHYVSHGMLFHLLRITPEGEIQDYYPWPEINADPLSYIEVLPSDTLLVVGSYGRPIARLNKAVIEEEGLTNLVVEEHNLSKAFHAFSPRLFNSTIVVEWENDRALTAGMAPHRTSPGLGPDKIGLAWSYLTPPYDEVSYESYSWRDYVWRSYPDTWIDNLTLTPHKDGGYSLLIPDPKDRTTTCVLRLDEDGVPIDPSILKHGGEHSARSFARLPSSAKPYAYFTLDCGDKKATVREAYVRISFWGCDDKGNLYAYRQLRKYPSEHPEN